MLLFTCKVWSDRSVKRFITLISNWNQIIIMWCRATRLTEMNLLLEYIHPLKKLNMSPELLSQLWLGKSLLKCYFILEPHLVLTFGLFLSIACRPFSQPPFSQPGKVYFCWWHYNNKWTCRRHKVLNAQYWLKSDKYTTVYFNSSSQKVGHMFSFSGFSLFSLFSMF